MSTPEKIAHDVHDLLFRVRKSIRYHHARRRFFDRNYIATNALTLIFGSAAIYFVLKELSPLYTVIAAALVSLASVLNMVVGNVPKARLHHDLAREFLTLERDIVAKAKPAQKDYAAFYARALEIESREPPTKRVLNILMHNEVCLAMGYKEEDEEALYKVGPARRMFAQLIDINPDGINPVKSKTKPRVPNRLEATPV